MSEVKPIYLYRRKGQTAWATCDVERFDEMQSMAMFATMTAYSSPDYARLEQERDQHIEMAGCMDLFRKDMIEAGVVGESCSPMFMTEGVLGYIGKLHAERDAALKQVEGLRAALQKIESETAATWVFDVAREALSTKP